MDFFFCLPIMFGCPNKIKQTSGQAHVCPRCHNAQVVTANSRTWFELCWIPLIPMKKKEIYVCGICQWQAPQGGQFQPPLAGQGGPGGPGYGGPGGQYPPKPN